MESTHGEVTLNSQCLGDIFPAASPVEDVSSRTLYISKYSTPCRWVPLFTLPPSDFYLAPVLLDLSSLQVNSM